jgi:hypothetical protein
MVARPLSMCYDVSVLNNPCEVEKNERRIQNGMEHNRQEIYTT